MTENAAQRGTQAEGVAYDASSIRVLSDAEIEARFEWAKVGALAAKYRKDPGWIARGLTACEWAGRDPSYFIRRYLDGDKSVPLDPDVNAAMELVLEEHRWARWR